MRYPFPDVLDSTILTTFKACPRQAWFSYVRRVTPAGLSIHLVAGGAMAKALEMARTLWYLRGVRDLDLIYQAAIETLWLNYDPATPIPDRHRAKGPEVLAEGLVKFLDSFAFQYDPVQPAVMPDGSRAIEFNFALPLPVRNPQTGDPILYCGRLDMIADSDGVLLAEDDKTTGSYGPSWSDNWRMRYQFLGYVWACQQHNLPVEGVIVRGLVLSLTKIETVQDIKLYPQWKVDRWYEQLIKDVNRFVTAWKDDDWEYDLSQACTSYGGCPFVDPCDSISHERALAEGLYVPNTWSPLHQIKEPV